MASSAETGYICAFPKMVQGSCLKVLDHLMPKLPSPLASPLIILILSWQDCQLQRYQPKTIKTYGTASCTLTILKKCCSKWAIPIQSQKCIKFAKHFCQKSAKMCLKNVFYTLSHYCNCPEDWVISI